MKNIKLLLSVVLCMMVMSVCSQPLEKGVAKELAEQRKSNISHVTYDLSFDIPANPQMKVTGKATISFILKERDDVVLDFQGKLHGSVLVGKKKRAVTYEDEHIVVPKKFLKSGLVTLTMEFESADDALNRHDDYMYSLFVPDKARTAFPCFDQPDLRARFNTRLHVPQGWKTMVSDGSNPIPTYLYSFVAGNFQEKTAKKNGRLMRALYRETDPQKVGQIDRIFAEAAHALGWMESYTGIACPFGEYGVVILPGYQFGGMEHPGAIQLSDRRVLLGRNPSKEDELRRSELIAHETAHLWFGDMVSLKWFEDVWTKEVFANFMASKITRSQYAKTDHELNFIKTYQTRAIAIDRTEGTHPIAMRLDNLHHASMLYDNIIYDKAPVMMRMLEEMMGPTKMQNGLRRYLSEHFFDNASWDELIETLDREDPMAGVRQFSEVWVKQKGMPTIHTSYKDGRLVISQKDPYGRGLCWGQKFQILVIEDLGNSRTLSVDMQQPTVAIRLKKKPAFVIPNYDGRGYGRFTVDEEYTKKLPLRLMTTRNDLNRYGLLLTIHDNYLMGRVNPAYFGELYRMMVKEKNPLIMATAIDHMMKIAFDMMPEQRRTLELCLTDLLGENKSKECRRLIVNKLAANMTAPEVMGLIGNIWESHSEDIFDEHDYMQMAYRLAMLQPDRWQEILRTERSRLQTDAERMEFDYVSRACNPDERKRTELFNSLLKPQNRQEEPWAIHVLDLLCSDVYEPGNIGYIKPGLSTLKFIQETSDIFFPGEWAKTLLAHHKGKQARKAVEDFLRENPDCPENLRNKILEAAWML